MNSSYGEALFSSNTSHDAKEIFILQQEARKERLLEDLKPFEIVKICNPA